MLRTSDFEYDLPPELIAQTPVPRASSRLLILDRRSGSVSLARFPDLLSQLHPGDVLALNDTRVNARRFRAERAGGGHAEALLLRERGEAEWDALVYPARKLGPGAELSLDAGELGKAQATVVETTAEGGRVLRFHDRGIRDALATLGTTPLPPYIREPLADEERYQTVYARNKGSAAAPTAGLHFTQDVIARAANLGVGIAFVTLHVGVDTFRPVREADAARHTMHGEWFSITERAASTINGRLGRLVAVGTTVVRALESSADESGAVRAECGSTRLFIRPGHRFRAVEALLTNFHLPRSTLLMLVAAFAGYESTMEAYRRAVAERLRFYSFGDAMLIV
jgi:S-adenosylmethionine:tRNA ribosyltransferase-isomerase